MSREMRRRDILAAAGAAALAGTSRMRPAFAAPQLDRSLRVGVYRGGDQTLLSGTGLDHADYAVQYGEFTGGNLINQAIDAGALDLGSSSEIPLVFAATARARLRAVATLEGPTANQAVIVPKDSPARSIADLRGKRVGYIRATTAHYFLIRMLQQHGMSFADIQPVAIGMSAGLSAMTSGALDAWATYGYVIPMLQVRIGTRTLQTATGILSGNYIFSAATADLDDPAFQAAALDYLSRLDRAYAILDADKPRWARLVSPVVGVPYDVVLADLRSFERRFHVRASRPSDIDSARAVAATFAGAGLLPKDVDVASSFSDSLSGGLPRA
ncbi:ABC transporter substrate-binding protein [Acetobacteraceae bacterium KSS8]|uniref:ABC transporter substrate-binding protein n=1 Tax=Endosaccharibacter trunci TaxID=2812733 RepID=A0ABT1W5J3_9PROT|nr:ABC transporter substrate-binding protein [Acetobacteraceae bacterium KSS8]